METIKTEMLCLNTAFVRHDETAKKPKTEAYIGKLENEGEAVFVTRVDNFCLSNEQAEKIREIHERNAAEVRDVLGWE